MTKPLEKPSADGAVQQTAADTPATLTDRVRALRLPDQPAAAGSRRNVLPWALCAVLLLTSVAFGVRAFTAPAASPKKADDAHALPGSTEDVAGSGDVVLESKGYIIPAHQIQVSPLVNGIVTELYIEEGKRVKQGDVLATLEDTQYAADRDHAIASVKVAQASIEAADASLEGAKANLQRAEADLNQMKAKLVQCDRDWVRAQKLGPSGALAGLDVDTIKANYETARANLAVGEAAIAQAKWGVAQAEKNKAQAERTKVQAEADLRKSQWFLDQCVVKAPITGTILTKKAEKGNIVNPIAFNISASLCDMADLSDLEVDLSIQERDIAQVHPGQKCRVVPEAYTSRHYDGVVSRLMPTADRAKGAIPVRVKVTVPREEEGVYLKPDMGVIVSFLKMQDRAAGEKK